MGFNFEKISSGYLEYELKRTGIDQLSGEIRNKKMVFAEEMLEYIKNGNSSKFTIIQADRKEEAIHTVIMLEEAASENKVEIQDIFGDCEDDGDFWGTSKVKENKNVLCIVDPNDYEEPHKRYSQQRELMNKALDAEQIRKVRSSGALSLKGNDVVALGIHLDKDISYDYIRGCVCAFAKDACKLYVYFYKEPEDDKDYFGDENISECILKLTLETEADVINALMTEAERFEYQKCLIDNAITGKGYAVSEDLDYESIIDASYKLNVDFFDNTIDKLVLSAVKHKKAYSVITNDDFKFIEKAGKQFKKKESITEFNPDNFVGQEAVMEEFDRFINTMLIDNLRASRGLKVDKTRLVILLIGPPGTGKTEYAKSIAKLAYAKGLVKGTRFSQINGAELKAEYQGQTAPNVKKQFKENDVFFVDEVYSMITDKRDMYGNEAVSQLLIELENLPEGKMVIFAGYGGKDMSDEDNLIKKFFNANPGIKSRIAKTIYFKPYDSATMVRICHAMARKKGLILGESLDGMIEEYFKTRTSANDFGNAREARSLMDAVKVIASNRIAKLDYKNVSNDELSMITEEDMKKAIGEAMEADLMRTGKVKAKIGFC